MQSEEEVLGFWARKKIFEKSVRARKGARRFVFWEGPPYANGKPGVHHVESRAFKDVVARYKTMRGFLVERRAGWDTHGLPTEVAAEKKLGITRKRDIEEKVGIRAFVEAAREDVFYYKTAWEKMTERMGYWVDLKNAYVTMTNDYIESLWWIVGEFWKKKLLYEDFKVLPWCTRCGTALSSHELAQGYKEITEESIYVRLRLKTRRASLLIWTTTPWTLPANVAAAVHPDKIYVTIDDKGDKLILQKSIAKKLFPHLEPMWEEKGESLAGLEYEPLYFAKEPSYKVVTADFVSDTEGTGIVHIAPVFGEDDMKVGKKENLPVLSPVDEEGKFTEAAPLWKDIFVKDADLLIIKDLDQKGFLWKHEPYTHDYPFCWRCDTPLLYFARRSWFLRVSSIRKELIETNKKINWYPAHLKEGRFGQWLREAKDWAFSRERYWGTPLPVWRCNKCENVEVFNSRAALGKRGESSGNVYYLMRHGYAENNDLDIVTSLPGSKYRLLPKGVRQIKTSAVKLAKEKIELIISSDLMRAKESTAILAKVLKVPVLYDHDLRDVNVGDLEGRKDKEFLERLSVEERFKVPFPGGGESWDDLKKRMYRLFRKLESMHKGRKILVVGHADPMWFLESIMKGDLKSFEAPRAKYLSNGDFHKIKPAPLPRNDKGELDLHRPYIDEFKISCSLCGGKVIRVSDVIDVWFDSGSMPYASWHYPFENKSRIDKKISFPADYIAEGVDQTRGWFYLLLAVSVLLGKGVPYKNVLSVGHVLDKDGKKMSKSRGNIVEPTELFDKYGADAVRWYFYTINQPEDIKLFDPKDIDNARRNFLSFFDNTIRFHELYKEIRHKKSYHILDRWILAKLALVRDGITKRLDKFDIVGAARVLEDFVVNDISRWYLRRSRDRMKKGEGLSVLRDVLLAVARMSAPFIPFSSEIAYQALGGKQESAHLEDWPEAISFDRKLLIDMEETRTLAARGLELRSRASIKVRQPLKSFSVKKTGLRNEAYFEILRDELNVKEIIVDKKLESDAALDTEITPVLRREGSARELVRQLQDMRKKARLDPEDFIAVSLDGWDWEEWLPVIAKGARIKKFVSTETIENPDIEEKLVVDGVSYVIRLKKI